MTPGDRELQREVLRLRTQNELLFKIVRMYRGQVHDLQRVIDSTDTIYDDFMKKIAAKD